jgi:predicted Zn-dependent peptidase
MGTPNMWTYEDVLNLKYEDVLEYYQYFLTSPCVITIAWDCLELKEFIYATIEEYCFDTKFKYHVLQNYTLTNEKVFKPVAYSNPNSVFFHSRIEWFWARDEYRYLTQAIVNKVLWLWAHSRLYRHIRSEMGYCYSISTGLNNFQKETYIELSWNSKLDHIPYIQDYFQNQFFQLISWWIWREEFDDAKESLLLSIPYRYETSSNIVTKINKRFLETWLIRDKKRYYDQLSCIEYEDIRRVFDWISVECKHFSI